MPAASITICPDIFATKKYHPYVHVLPPYFPRSRRERNTGIEQRYPCVCSNFQEVKLEARTTSACAAFQGSERDRRVVVQSCLEHEGRIQQRTSDKYMKGDVVLLCCLARVFGTEAKRFKSRRLLELARNASAQQNGLRMISLIVGRFPTGIVYFLVSVTRLLREAIHAYQMNPPRIFSRLVGFRSGLLRLKGHTPFHPSTNGCGSSGGDVIS